MADWAKEREKRQRQADKKLRQAEKRKQAKQADTSHAEPPPPANPRTERPHPSQGHSRGTAHFPLQARPWALQADAGV